MIERNLTPLRLFVAGCLAILVSGISADIVGSSTFTTTHIGMIGIFTVVGAGFWAFFREMKAP